MIFTTKCTDGKDRKFQVFFTHKDKTCTCEIWEMTGLATNELHLNTRKLYLNYYSPKPLLYVRIRIIMCMLMAEHQP